jgi:hypothetical protein
MESEISSNTGTYTTYLDNEEMGSINFNAAMRFIHD